MDARGIIEQALAMPAFRVNTLNAILVSFSQYLQAGLAAGVSLKRRGQVDVVALAATAVTACASAQ